MTVLSDRVDALEQTNATLVDILNGLKGTLQAQIAAGRGLIWQGEWATSTAYTAVDAVHSDGTSYVCIAGHTSGASTEPGIGASWETYWEVLAAGNGSWHVDPGAPSGGLGADGDFYLDTTSGDIYYKTSGTWAVEMNIVGPQGDKGDTGDTGATGAAGADGAVWHSGSGAPAGALGADGDFYLDTGSGDVYEKDAGSWSVIDNLTGPQGDKGDTGDTGQKGDKGDTGDTGPQGDPGADLDWSGAWVTSTSYVVNKAVENDGSSYVCTSDHTSGASTEPGVGGSWQTVWDLMAARGADGAGSGTVTSVDVTGGTGIDSSGGPVTTSGAITVALDSATQASLGKADTAQQPPSEGAFVDGDKTKLDGIETGADVTDTANVTAAGALMDSEVDANIKTLTLPASTTISAFGASLVDDATAGDARTTLGLGSAATSASSAFATAAQGTKADDAMPKAGGVFTGAVTLDEVRETSVALSGTTPSLDLSAGTDFSLTTTGNTTVAVTNAPAGKAWVATLLVTLGGAHTLAITSADWGDAGAPTGLASSDTIEITLRGVGTTFRASETWRSS